MHAAISFDTRNLLLIKLMKVFVPHELDAKAGRQWRSCPLEHGSSKEEPRFNSSFTGYHISIL